MRSFLCSIFPTNLTLNICLEAINSKFCSRVFVPDKMLELKTEKKRLIHKKNLKFMPFVKIFFFMPIWNYAICEVTVIEGLLTVTSVTVILLTF